MDTMHSGHIHNMTLLTNMTRWVIYIKG